MKSRLTLSLLFLFLLGGCQKHPSSSEVSNPITSPSTEVTPLSINITKEGTTIYDLNLDVGEEVLLSAEVLPVNALQSVTWTVSDNNVATILDNGLLKGEGVGEAIVTVTSKVKASVSSQLFINVSEKVEQTGVGRGTSIDDPIFQGFEGDAPLEIYFLETYHIYADAILLKKGNIEILIDGGWHYDGQMNQAFIEEKVSDGRLDMVIATHGHADHYEAIPTLVENIDAISTFLDYGLAGGESGGYKTLVRNRIASDNAYYYGAYDSVHGLNDASKRYYFTNEFYVDVLNTGAYGKDASASSGNEQSLALLFTYKDFTFLTSGDLTISGEQGILSNEDVSNVSLYKAAHHGSHGSNDQTFLNTINPYTVAITAARAGQYGVAPGPVNPSYTYNLDGKSGHPASQAVERIYKIPRISLNLNVYWNMPAGTMKFTTFGGETDLIMEGTETIRGYYDLTKTAGVAVWDEALGDFKNKVTGEEKKKFHETKVFSFREYEKYLPPWVTA